MLVTGTILSRIALLSDRVILLALPYALVAEPASRARSVAASEASSIQLAAEITFFYYIEDLRRIQTWRSTCPALYSVDCRLSTVD